MPLPRSSHAAPPHRPKVAVVIPIFRHSVLLVDAIESALSQVADFEICIILVNDGCPFSETDEVCRDYALAYSKKIIYLKKINSGLSATRNFGVRFALKRWPSIEAVYFLDADNILRERSISRAMDHLNRNKDTSWIYPNIDMFGIAWNGDYGGKYSLLLHAEENLCEAGSLVHRRVFDGGIYFDEEFKFGYEDWDFFLCASAKGFKGENIENFGFRYRKRPASMLAGSTRMDQAIRSSIEVKHKKLYQPKNLLRLEHNDFPRYAIYLSDKDLFLICIDPNIEPEYWSKDEFILSFWQSQISPGRFHSPQFILTTTSLIFDCLREYKILQWILWHLQIELNRSHISTLFITTKLGRLRFIEDYVTENESETASISMIHPKILREIIKDVSTSWFDSFLTSNSSVTVSSLAVSLPYDARPAHAKGDVPLGASMPPTDASADLHRLIHEIRKSRFKGALGESWEWREPGVSGRMNPSALVTRRFSSYPAFPKLSLNSRNIGFILPVVEFGGVEKVALNIAIELKSQGWTPHLFIFGSQDIALSKEWTSVFETIAFLPDSDFPVWGETTSSYYGTGIPSWGTGGKHDMALSLLYWLDIVINFHAASVAGVMGQLKRFGIKTAISLHLHDLSTASRPVGNVYLGLAYEHDYDYFLPCSQQLADWCHGMGVPKDKIIPIINAPSFTIDSKNLHLTQKQRPSRKSTQALRVLYIGRLDYQKGIDELGVVIRTLKKENVFIEWRIVGKAVLDSDDHRELSDDIFPYVEAPKSTPVELAEAYAWADVLILLSRYEGLPLTILEALRSGVLPLVTNVGAVNEVVQHNFNGILIDTNDVQSSCLQHLRMLSLNRNELLRMSNNAFKSAQLRNWNNAIKNINLKFCESLDRRNKQTNS